MAAAALPHWSALMCSRCSSMSRATLFRPLYNSFPFEQPCKTDFKKGHFEGKNMI